MSLTNVVSYFRTIMRDQLQFTEHKDFVNLDNNPSTLIHKSFHIELGETTNRRQNMNDIELDQEVMITFWHKGFKEPLTARDNAVSALDTLIKKSLAPARRLTGNLKNVVFNSASHEALSESNDNLVKTTARFTAFVILKPDPESGP